MARFLKYLAGALMLPLCWAATVTLRDLILSIRPPSYTDVPQAAWGLAIGFALWLFIYFCLSPPMRTYVLAHELTHALWGWVMGARVKRMRVSSKGGSVTLSKSNFVIALAPYFFPLYTVLAILGHQVLGLFFDLRGYEPFWTGLVGLTWGFHLTFTVTTLLQHQPDIHENGRLFSYALIYLLNALGIALWIVMVTSPTMSEFAITLGNHIRAGWAACWRALVLVHGSAAALMDRPGGGTPK